MLKKKTAPEPPPIIPTAPIAVLTPLQWRENSGLQARLRALLTDPVMQMAEQTLLMQGMPVPSVMSAVPGVSGDAFNAVLAGRYNKAAGFAGYHNALHKLTLPAGADTRTEAMFWGTLKDDSE